MQCIDQIGIGSLRLSPARFELAQDILDAIDRGQDERHGLAGHRHAVAKLAHQRLRRMSERL